MRWTSTPWLLIAIGCIACGGATGDGRTSDATPNRLLGLDPPTTEAVVFAPGVVSRRGTYEYALSLHPAGDRLLYTVETPGEGAAVYQIRYESGDWTSPTRCDLSHGARSNEMEAFFSRDGSTVFFAPFTEGMDVRIWTARVTPDGFADPRPLDGPIAGYPSFFAVAAADGTLFHTNLAERTVYRAVLEDGRVIASEPVGLGPAGHAFPSPDGRYLLLDSAAPDDAGQRDIFVSFRNDDGSWSAPRPLGPTVNTEVSETCPSLSPDGRLLFFSRYNEPGGISDIYWVSSEIVDEVAPD